MAATDRIFIAAYATGNVSIIDGAFNSNNDHPTPSKHGVWCKPVALAVNPVTNKVFILTESVEGPIGVLDATALTTTFLLAGTARVPKAVAVNPVTNKAYGWNPDEKQEMSVGFGSYDRTIDALEQWFSGHHFVCGDRFTMADVYVGSAIDWGLAFGTIPERPAFAAYAERFRTRDAYREAKAIDTQLIEEMRANG